MADNSAGQTRTKTDKQDAPGAAQGKVVFDATAIVATDSTRIDAGFRPSYVRWINLTDRVQIEWFDGMAANTCLKTGADGARTLETTNGGITVDDRGFRVLQNATLAAVLASKTCVYEARV